VDWPATAFLKDEKSVNENSVIPILVNNLFFHLIPLRVMKIESLWRDNKNRTLPALRYISYSLLC
jgi:hypothetical protein